jgi:hypothetical protein
MDALAELITRVLETQRVELAAAREVAGAATYLQAQRAYGAWLLACAEHEAARARLHARIHAQAAMPPTLSDLRINSKEGT